MDEIQHNKDNVTKKHQILPLAKEIKREFVKASMAQQRLWVVNNLIGNKAAYNEPLHFIVQGDLDLDVLEKAFNILIQRQESLRTFFKYSSNTLYQRVVPKEGVHFKITREKVDQAPNQQEMVERFTKEEMLKEFDLSKPYLFQAKVVSMPDQTTLVLITFHHIIWDGWWSRAVLVRELSHIYNCLLSDQTINLPSLEVDYSDFSEWQRGWLQGEVVENQLKYWENQLSDAPESLNLPHDFLRGTSQTYQAGTVSYSIPENIVSRLKALSEGQDTTLYVALLALTHTLLSFYSQQDDIVMGTPFAGRRALGRKVKELDHLIGFFVTSIPIRAQINAADSFLTLLQQIKERVLEAYSNQDVPFDQIVERLKVSRQAHMNPVFQVMMKLQNDQADRLKLGDCTVEELNTPLPYAKLDLTFNYFEQADGSLKLILEYSKDLFKLETIQQLGNHCQNLLKSVVEKAAQPLKDHQLLSPEEYQRIIYDWNKTEQEYSYDKTIHQLFEEQVERAPDNIALVLEDEKLTYKELNEKANQLAHYLREKGVKPDTFVAINLERGFDLIVGILAVLKAGGAYVPLDPDYPEDRLNFILQDSKSPIVLTFSRLLEKFQDNELEAIAIDQINCQFYEKTNPKIMNTANDLAYVIYTSGSTGNPKGALLEHRGLCNLAQAKTRCLAIEASDRVLQFASINFDASVWEWCPTLLAGATLVLVKSKERLISKGLEQTLHYHSVSIATIPPSLLNTISPVQCPSLRILIVGGESTPEQVLQLWSTHCTVINAYGPTEATVCVSLTPYKKNYPANNIGLPLDNTKLYILDPNLKPIPQGAVGELYIGGVGLARGYLNKSDLTAEKFISNPHATEEDKAKGWTKLYKSGDLARYLPDGNIEYIGRTDHQIKIRGFRVELGEIENALLSFKGVQQALVLVQGMKGESAHKTLIGYYVASHQSSENELKQYLQEKLPSYMAPSFLVRLEEFPVTRNGKIDRKALPVPDLTPQETYVAPSNSLEQKLCKVWENVLKIEKVGVNSNFFDLGGNSILLVMVQSELQTQLNIEIPITALFNYPTIKKLASYIEPKSDLSIENKKSRKSRQKSLVNDRSIAVVGVSGRFPGAEDPHILWDKLTQGLELVSELSTQEMKEAGVPEEVLENPDYVRKHGVLPDVRCFDANFFGYSPREAQLMDPQQRIFLESAWHVLEDAGYDPKRFQGKIGVYAGQGPDSYLLVNLASHLSPSEIEANFYPLGMGNNMSFLSARTSYKLDLVGPAVTVETACSTSLVAIHMACISLLAGDCNMAIAGGVSLIDLKKRGYLYQEGMIYSKDGKCRAFDANATGIVNAQGTAIVLLKPLDQAIEDGDHIYAVIKGSAVNNDGYNKIGFTAPSAIGQTEVIQDAMERANLEPDDISFVECHGTGTVLGDPIEIEGLTQAYQGATQKCAIGSLKTNIGHMDAGAGAASFIKTALSLYHRKLVPTLHFSEPNPKIKFGNFYVNTQTIDWDLGNKKLRAGVNSFGFGGTNAHAILEEAPFREEQAADRDSSLLLLSAKTEDSLRRLSHNLAAHLESKSDINLCDVAYTLAVGRNQMGQRRFVVGADHEALKASLLNDFVIIQPVEQSIAFVFPGQGSEYLQMGQQLYQNEKLFAKHFDTCIALLKQLFPTEYQDLSKEDCFLREGNFEPKWIQLSLFILEYSLGAYFIELGIEPNVMMGHSLGEYVAATLAGVFSLKDALKIVHKRGELSAKSPESQMLSILMAPEALQKMDELIGLDIAVINGAETCVVAGNPEQLAVLHEALNARNITNKYLKTTKAFHSRVLDPILDEFRAFMGSIDYHLPSRPLISCANGQWIKGDEMGSAEYWVSHLRNTVNFFEGAKTLYQNFSSHELLVLEVGPGKVLSGLLRNHPNRPQSIQILTSLLAESEYTSAQTALGNLWASGVEIDWDLYYSQHKRLRIPLPTYPFERQIHWVEPKNSLEKSEISEPNPTAEVNSSNHHATAYQDEIEQQVANIWKDILGVKTIQNQDNFFSLGGDSMIALQLVARVSKKFSVNMPSNILMQHSTLEAFVTFIKSNAPLKTQERSNSSGDVQQEIANIWKDILGVKTIQNQDNFFSLGGDSMIALQLIARVSKKFSVNMPSNILMQHPTLEAFVTFIKSNVPFKTQEKPTSPKETGNILMKIHSYTEVNPQHNNLPLILIHPIGGDVYFYRDMASRLQCEVYAVKSPLLVNQSYPITEPKIEDMAQFYLSEIEKQGIQYPFVLGGASFGGLVAYEMGQILEGQGKKCSVILIDAPIPEQVSKNHLNDDVKILRYLTEHVFPVSEQELRQVNPAHLIQFVTEKARQTGYQDLFSEEFLERYLKTWKSNSEALFRYQIKSTRNQVLYFEAIEAMDNFPSYQAAFWEKHVHSDNIKTISVPGNHITMNNMPNCNTISEKINQLMVEESKPRMLHLLTNTDQEFNKPLLLTRKVLRSRSYRLLRVRQIKRGFSLIGKKSARRR